MVISLPLTISLAFDPCEMDEEVDTCSQIQEWIIRMLLNWYWNLTQKHLIRKKREPSYTNGGKVNRYSHYGSLKN